MLIFLQSANTTKKLRTKTHVCGQLKVGRFNVRAFWCE